MHLDGSFGKQRPYLLPEFGIAWVVPAQAQCAERYKLVQPNCSSEHGWITLLNKCFKLYSDEKPGNPSWTSPHWTPPPHFFLCLFQLRRHRFLQLSTKFLQLLDKWKIHGRGVSCGDFEFPLPAAHIVITKEVIYYSYSRPWFCYSTKVHSTNTNWPLGHTPKTSNITAVRVLLSYFINTTQTQREKRKRKRNWENLFEESNMWSCLRLGS